MRSQLDPASRIAKRIALAGIGVSSALAALNLAVGLLAGSTSVLAIGLELTGDVLVSAVVLFGALVANRPADEEHPYGHGRFEILAAFVVGMILVFGGIGVGWSSLRNVGATHPPPGLAAVGVLLLAIVARSVTSVLKLHVGRRIRSASLLADGWNDAVDVLAASVALTAVGLAGYDPARFLAADHYGGFAVGIVIVLTGLRVLRDASLELGDTMPPSGMVDEVRAMAAEVPGVLSIEKTHARKSGFAYHVDLHVQVDPELTVAASHAIAGRVRSRLRSRLGWVADVLVHVEPVPAPKRPEEAPRRGPAVEPPFGRPGNPEGGAGGGEVGRARKGLPR